MVKVNRGLEVGVLEVDARLSLWTALYATTFVHLCVRNFLSFVEKGMSKLQGQYIHAHDEFIHIFPHVLALQP